jgi:hypothetical protein
LGEPKADNIVSLGWVVITTTGSDAPDLLANPCTTPPEPDLSAPRCSTRVKALPTHLSDYHCYSAIATLHEPHSFYEAHTGPLWQKVMSKEFTTLTKTHT